MLEPKPTSFFIRYAEPTLSSLRSTRNLFSMVGFYLFRVYSIPCTPLLLFLFAKYHDLIVLEFSVKSLKHMSFFLLIFQFYLYLDREIGEFDQMKSDFLQLQNMMRRIASYLFGTM